MLCELRARLVKERWREVKGHVKHIHYILNT